MIYDNAELGGLSVTEDQLLARAKMQKMQRCVGKRVLLSLDRSCCSPSQLFAPKRSLGDSDFGNKRKRKEMMVMMKSPMTLDSSML